MRFKFNWKIKQPFRPTDSPAPQPAAGGWGGGVAFDHQSSQDTSHNLEGSLSNFSVRSLPDMKCGGKRKNKWETPTLQPEFCDVAKGTSSDSSDKEILDSLCR